MELRYRESISQKDVANSPWNSLPVINASRVSLRLITERDVDSLYAIYSDSGVMRYWGTPITDRREAVELLAVIHEGFQRREFLQWGIALKSDDQMIGTATLFYLDLNQHRTEIGYALARAHWGKGYMEEALQALLAYAFRDLDLNRIEADVDPRNVASIKLLERLGFQKEGHLRERWVANKEVQDSLVYGLLRREWNDNSVVFEVITPPVSQTKMPSTSPEIKARSGSSRFAHWHARRPFRTLARYCNLLITFITGHFG